MILMNSLDIHSPNIDDVIGDVTKSPCLPNKVDLFVGSASTSIYEMSFLKTPSIFVICSKNQDYKIFEMEKLGHYFLINLSEFRNKNFIKFLNVYINNFHSNKNLFFSRKVMIDNMGTQRVAKVIKKI